MEGRPQMGTEVERPIVIDITISFQGLLCSLQIRRRGQHSKARGESVEGAESCGLHSHLEESHCLAMEGPCELGFLGRWLFRMQPWLWAHGSLLR